MVKPQNMQHFMTKTSTLQKYFFLILT